MPHRLTTVWEKVFLVWDCSETREQRGHPLSQVIARLQGQVAVKW